MKNKIDIKKWKEFKISDLFDAKNTGNILARDIINGSGNTPYVTASGVLPDPFIISLANI